MRKRQSNNNRKTNPNDFTKKRNIPEKKNIKYYEDKEKQKEVNKKFIQNEKDYQNCSNIKSKSIGNGISSIKEIGSMEFAGRKDEDFQELPFLKRKENLNKSLKIPSPLRKIFTNRYKPYVCISCSSTSSKGMKKSCKIHDICSDCYKNLNNLKNSEKNCKDCYQIKHLKSLSSPIKDQSQIKTYKKGSTHSRCNSVSINDTPQFDRSKKLHISPEKSSNITPNQKLHRKSTKMLEESKLINNKKISKEYLLKTQEKYQKIEKKENYQKTKECLSCGNILISKIFTDNNCKKHIYCPVCKTKSKNLSKIKECDICSSEFQNRNKKKLKMINASFHVEKNNSFSSPGADNTRQHQPKKFYSPAIKNITKSDSESNNKSSNRSDIPQINKKDFVNSKKNSIVQTILCMKCKKTPSENQLLCTHSVCSSCLINTCYTKISKFFSEYQQDSSIVYNNFCYYCPVEDCNQEISVPTKMIIENVHKYYSGPDLNFDVKLFEPWISYFDGLPFFEESSDNKNDKNLSENIKNLRITTSLLPDILKPNCDKCCNSNEITAFLCNHKICKKCLTYSCCVSIENFLNKYKINPGIINSRFYYTCPVCNSKISVPTFMIIKNYINCFKTDEKFKKFEEIMENDTKDVERLIWYFDGLCIALE